VWLHLGDARLIGLADARRLAARIMLDVAEGKDPATERKAERLAGTFADLAEQYVELHAKRHNKSWRQAGVLVRKHLLPRWGKLRRHHQGGRQGHDDQDRGPDRGQPGTQGDVGDLLLGDIRQEIIAINPCKLVDKNPTQDRSRVLSDAEVALLWPSLDPALKLMLLTGQRPGEVRAMERGHIAGGWWQMPGKPNGNWPGTKNGRDHRVWLSEPALDLVESHVATGSSRSSALLKKLVAEHKIERVTPHDLRRTCLTWITRLGFGRDAMDRVANHKTSKVTDVYDRHGYAEEDQRIMNSVANHLRSLVDGTGKSNVVSLR
jgi:integrase